MTLKCSECGAIREKRRTTARAPYHYVLSGLPNVYLVGIELARCPNGHGDAPIIPRMGPLHRAIAKSLIDKPAPLTGDEVRFLRKHAGIAANDFAAQLRITKHTLSRIENGAQKMGPMADKLTRAIAAAAAEMSEARAVLLSGDVGEGKAKARIVLEATPRGWREAA